MGLGSNLGRRREKLIQALRALRRMEIEPVEISSIWETEPVGPPDQPDYLNAVCRVRTRLKPRALLSACLQAEERLGRVRSEKWGPRTIDLDILFYGGQIVDRKGLKIPHPQIADRKFVLEPLCEIAPDFRDPVSQRTVRELLQDCPDRGRCERLYSRRQTQSWILEL